MRLSEVRGMKNVTLLLTLALSFHGTGFCQTTERVESGWMHPQLANTTERLTRDNVSIDAQRKSELDALANWVAGSLHAKQSAQLTFICTHNSRRSHFAQVWAQVAAIQAGLSGVITFSGGTEATACNPRTIRALERAGFDIAVQADSAQTQNPTYLVSAGASQSPMACFSKVYSDKANPSSEFAAVMTCSEADKGCPVVYGAEARFSLPYVDPKMSDDTEDEIETYDLRLRQIATEMIYVMEKAAQIMSTH